MNKYIYSNKLSEAKPYPSGLKGIPRKFFRHIRLSYLDLVNKSCNDKFLRPLFCHYVFDDQVEKFEKIIIELKKIGTFIDTDTCIDMLEGKKAIDGKYFHLSFDDGFRNIYTNAAPVLKKHNIPAIIFVPSSIIDADYSTVKKYCLETTQYKGVIEMLTWDDLAVLISDGFDIGSHTKNHYRFSDMSGNLSLLEEELLGSKQEIEKRLGIECKYIACPYGGIKDVNNVSLDMTKEVGYNACFGAYRGSVIPDKTNRYFIPRHHFESQWPISHIKFFLRGNMEYKSLKD